MITNGNESIVKTQIMQISILKFLLFINFKNQLCKQRRSALMQVYKPILALLFSYIFLLGMLMGKPFLKMNWFFLFRNGKAKDLRMAAPKVADDLFISAKNIGLEAKLDQIMSKRTCYFFTKHVIFSLKN